MASQTYNFLMSNNFTTRVVLSDQSVGTLNYTVTFIRPSTFWTSFNLNTGTSGPEWSFNMSGTNSPSLGSGISGFWNYDFRNLPEKSVTKCVVNAGNTLVRVNGDGFAALEVGDIIKTGTTGIPNGTRITGFEGVSSINIRLSAAPTESSSSRTLVFGTPNTNLTTGVFSGSVSVPPGSTVNFGGLVESKGSAGEVAISGSFVTLADPNEPPPPDPTPAPSFSDQSITTTWIKTLNFSGAPDRRVAASDTSSYSIVASGTGLSPTAWLTINSSGQLSGVPAAVGVYTFRVRATGDGGSTNSSIITLTINPPGNRSTGVGVATDLTFTERFTGSAWVKVNTFKRFDGNNWVDITN